MAIRQSRFRQLLRHLVRRGSLALLASGTAFFFPAASPVCAAPPVELGAPEFHSPQSAETADRWQPVRGNVFRRTDDGAARVVSRDAAEGTTYLETQTVAPNANSVRWRIRDGQPTAANYAAPAPQAASAPRSFAAPDNVRALRPTAGGVRVIRQVNDEQAVESQDHPQHDPFGDRRATGGAVLNSPDLNPPAAETPFAENRAPATSRYYAPGVRLASQAPGELPQLPADPPLSGPPLRPLPAAPPRTVDDSAPGNLELPPASDPANDPAPEAAPDRTAQPLESAEPESRPLSAPRAGSIRRADPQRNTEFCQQTYNERNCCSDGNECQAHRERVRSHPLSKISLDITPTCNLSTRRGGEQTKCGFPFEDAPSRVWRDRSGETLAEGRVTALANLRLDITNDDGRTVRIRVRDLGEDDICFLAAWCGVPSECRLDDVALSPRNWSPLTMTWKASGLCHRPLYFEEVQLERYGHTTGPFAQPILSGAHFFANIAVLPYKMGIHPLNECQYSLGYYRPGNCAPWLVPPIPLSLRGATAEAAVILGGIYILP